MSDAVEVDAKLEQALLERLKDYAEASGRPISELLAEAVAEYLDRACVRPAFRAASDAVLDEHSELLQRLAR